MKVEDIKSFTDVLNKASDKIKEAADAAQESPMKVMDFVPTVMDHFRKLQDFGNLGEITASVITDEQKDSVQQAIQSFLDNTKEAQEKVGSMGAALFSNPMFVSFRNNLEQVKTSLERGKKVDPAEEGHGL